MAKRTSGTRIADGISSYIDKAVGKLTTRRDALRKELDQVERELAGVRSTVMAGLKGSGTGRRGVRSVVRATRQLSSATRKKMADAAKRRWAAAKKAGLNKLG